MTRASSFALALLVPALAATLAPTPSLAQSGPYKILSTHKLGGDGGWDYLAADSSARRLYLARSGDTGSLHVYNLDTLAPIGDVPVGSAHGAAIDDATHHVYILSHVSPNVTVIDSKTGDIVKAFDVGGAPEQSVLDNHGHLFIDLEDKDAIAVVDTATFAVTAKYDISSQGGGCAGLAIDTAHGVLFAACRDKNNMIILSAADGKILTTLPIGVGCDGAFFNPATHEVFSTQGDGTLTVIKESSPTTFAVEQTLATQKGARTITVDQKTGHIFTATAEFGPAPALKPGERYARAPMIPGTFTVFVIGK